MAEVASVAPSVIPLSRTRGRRARELGHAGDQRVTARLVMSAPASQRLLQLVGEGVYDYLLIPVNGGLSVRLNLTINTVQSIEQPATGGKVVIDWVRSAVSNGDNRIAMSRTELRLLNALLERPNIAVPRADLIAKLWPTETRTLSDTENALGVYVCGLRKRLAAIGLGTALQTVRGVGYRIRL